MKSSLLALWLFVGAATGVAQEEKQVETRELNLVVGIDKVIDLDFQFSSNMYLGDSSIVKVEPDLKRQTVTFIGVKEGNTSLTIKDSLGEERIRYILSITTNDQSRTVSELRELLGDIEGLEIGVKGGRVYVGGKIIVPNDIGKVATVLEVYPDVLRLVEMSPITQKIIAQKMQEELVRNNFRDVAVRVVNDAFWVEGVVGDEGEEKLVKQIAIAYLPDKVDALASQSARVVAREDKSSILFLLSKNKDKSAQQEPLPKLVKISTQFVELTKDYSRIFGFRWAPALGADSGRIQLGRRSDGEVTSSSNNAFTATISNLFPKIQAMKNAGYGRIIQSGMVVTEDEKKGSVTKNTQAPFLVGAGEFARASIQEVQFTMGVTPKVLQDDNVNLELQVTVSLPAGQRAVTGEPITTSNTVETFVMVKSGESAVVGGVVQSQSLTGYDKNDPGADQQAMGGGLGGAPGAGGPVPGAAQAPNNFFMFLRSKSFNVTKNQYVVFVTPELLQSASGGTEKIKRKFRRRGF